MKARRPEIFVSATSADLRTCRGFIKEAILSLGCAPVEQTNFPPDASSVRDMLRKRIQQCDAVIHVAGIIYGGEPRVRDEGSPRRSYTQLEYEIAMQLGKPVYVFICGDGFPYDEHAPEDDEKQELQQQHRTQLRSSDHLYTPVGTRDELRNRIYQLQTHVEMLGEELKRSRLWLKRGLAIGAAILVLTILTIPFSSDIRDRFRSKEDRVIDQLERKGIAVDVEGVGRALAAASVADLNLFLESGIDDQTLNAAFADHAANFFERSRGVPEAVEWLRQALAHGLDPNLAANYEYYGKEGILAAAMRASNADATVALLEAGASPHPYQALHYTEPDIPRILFPYHYALTDERMNRTDKGKVARAMKESGAVLVTLEPEGAEQWVNRAHRQTIANISRNAETVFGIPVPAKPSACGKRTPTPICRDASERTGTDWCDAMKSLPRRVLWKKESYDPRLLRFDIQYLLTVLDGRGYVLVTDTLGPHGGYGLLELSADQTHWYLYKYTPPAAGMGFCKARPDDGWVPEYCWRRWSLTYSPGADVVKVDDYYEYEALFDCDKKRPEGS